MTSAATDPIKTWEIKASTGRHFDVLDGIRGVAILMVVVYHTFYTNPTNSFFRGVQGLIESGWIGVPVFFVLSGFLISYPFFQAREKDIRAWYVDGYARRRLGKIIPPYYLSIVIFVTLYLFLYHDSTLYNQAWESALGVPNLVFVGQGFNPSYWSLIIEAHFYLVLPLLFFATRGWKVRHSATAMFLVLAIVPFAVRQLTWPADPLANIRYTGFLMSRFPCQLDYFAWGVLFAGMYVSFSGIREKLKFLSALGYAGVLLFAVTLGLFAMWANQYGIHAQPALWSTEVFHWLPSVASFLMLFFVFDPACLGSRLLGSSWLRFTGIVSYEWFLFHGPVVNRFSDMFGKTHGSLFSYGMKTVVPLALTFLFSAAVYRWFSLPILKRIRAGVKPQGKPGAA